eukprot:s781_g12.t1
MLQTGSPLQKFAMAAARDDRCESWHRGKHFKAQPAIVYGIDFSGASDAGKKLLIARCDLQRSCVGWTLTVVSIRAARNLPGGGLSPDTATAALRSELLEAAKSQAQVIVGVDSPPSIAKQFIAQKDWATWVAKFFRNYPTPAAFRKATSLLRSGHCKKSRIEPKRMTDVRHKTPLAPQNLRMYKQTWWAITGVYLPLAQSGFCVAPCMPIGRKQKHLLMESCPASLLKRLDLYSKPYKGKDVKHVQRRRFIMKSLKKGIPVGGRSKAKLRVDFGVRTLTQKLLTDAGADSLDAVLAAVGAACSVRRNNFPAPEDGEMLDVYKLEACVYS